MTEQPAPTGMILHYSSHAKHTNGICKGLSDGPLCCTQLELVLVAAPKPLLSLSLAGRLSADFA